MLDVKVGNLVFPDWEKSFGWKAVGHREDELSGRGVTTVFYRNPDGVRLGYAVVAGDVLAATRPGARSRARARPTASPAAASAPIVTWTQQGHTCVIVAPSAVPRAGLLDLAASRNV